MSADLEPGDWVESLVTERGEGCRIERGNVYQVEEIYPPQDGLICRTCDGDTMFGLGLAGQPHYDEGHWCGCSFRPIYRPRAQAFDHLLQPVPAETEAA